MQTLSRTALLIVSTQCILLSNLVMYSRVPPWASVVRIVVAIQSILATCLGLWKLHEMWKKEQARTKQQAVPEQPPLTRPGVRAPQIHNLALTVNTVLHTVPTGPTCIEWFCPTNATPVHVDDLIRDGEDLYTVVATTANKRALFAPSYWVFCKKR